MRSGTLLRFPIVVAGPSADALSVMYALVHDVTSPQHPFLSPSSFFLGLLHPLPALVLSRPTASSKSARSGPHHVVCAFCLVLVSWLVWPTPMVPPAVYVWGEEEEEVAERRLVCFSSASPLRHSVSPLASSSPPPHLFATLPLSLSCSFAGRFGRKRPYTRCSTSPPRIATLTHKRTHTQTKKEKHNERPSLSFSLSLFGFSLL